MYLFGTAAQLTDARIAAGSLVAAVLGAVTGNAVMCRRSTALAVQLSTRWKVGYRSSSWRRHPLAVLRPITYARRVLGRGGRSRNCRCAPELNKLSGWRVRC